MIPEDLSLDFKHEHLLKYEAPPSFRVVYRLQMEI